MNYRTAVNVMLLGLYFYRAIYTVSSHVVYFLLSLVIGSYI